MLIVSRLRNQSINIGPDIVVHVVEIRGQQVRIGIEASPFVKILRTELVDAEHSIKSIERIKREYPATDEEAEEATWKEWNEKQRTQ